MDGWIPPMLCRGPEPCEVWMVESFAACGGGDPSLLSSVPGRPRGTMAEKAGSWGGGPVL